MKRLVGTVSRGIRTPIIREGDDLIKIVVDSVIAASRAEDFSLNDRDVVGITEAVVGRAQGNYANTDQIAEDIRSKFTDGTIGLVFPILSRNRFSVCLRGIARGAKKLVIMLSFPADEVGNHLVDIDELDAKGVNPWTDTLSEEDFHDLFGSPKHSFTGIDYLKYYREIVESQGCELQIVLSNSPQKILDYTKNVLYCDVHTRHRTRRIIEKAGAEVLYGLEDILAESVAGSGYNQEYGLLGSNMATDESVKLFPRDTKELVEAVAASFKAETGKDIEVMVYGDGAFKDPVGKIWELADPVVSPAYTSGLEGQPNEIKLKYLADNDFAHLNGIELEKAVSDYIQKSKNEKSGKDHSLGTTPRQLTDLLGSLCDLTSGSGDKGTPVVLIQGYFDNFSK